MLQNDEIVHIGMFAGLRASVKFCEGFVRIVVPVFPAAACQLNATLRD